ncbi:MAG: hypothetical protein CL959_01530 [Euryarchaeota archaeon]|nr:hypothetical protein [Euryarchaeota archaeon]
MINSVEDLRSAGVLPTGPVSAWPKSRNVAGEKMKALHKKPVESPSVKASLGQMAGSLGRVAMQGIRNGRVSAEVREERYAICNHCPAFRKQDKRCSECGCFMEAKTWVGGDPDQLCPLQKWPL